MSVYTVPVVLVLLLVGPLLLERLERRVLPASKEDE